MCANLPLYRIVERLERLVDLRARKTSDASTNCGKAIEIAHFMELILDLFLFLFVQRLW